MILKLDKSHIGNEVSQHTPNMNQNLRIIVYVYE